MCVYIYSILLWSWDFARNPFFGQSSVRCSAVHFCNYWTLTRSLRTLQSKCWKWMEMAGNGWKWSNIRCKLLQTLLWTLSFQSVGSVSWKNSSCQTLTTWLCNSTNNKLGFKRFTHPRLHCWTRTTRPQRVWRPQSIVFFRLSFNAVESQGLRQPMTWLWPEDGPRQLSYYSVRCKAKNGACKLWAAANHSQ